MAWASCSSTRMGSSWRTESRSSSSRSMPRRSTPEKYDNQNTHIQNSASHHSATTRSSSGSSSLFTHFNSGHLVPLASRSSSSSSDPTAYLYLIFPEMYWSKLELAAAPGAGGALLVQQGARLTSGMFVVESGLWLACSQQMESLCCSCLRATAFSCS